MKSQPSAESRDPSGGSPRSFVRPLFFAITLLLAAAVVFAWAVPARSATIPTISIESVVTDQTVAIDTHNFPPNQNFTVTMGPFGSRGEKGIVVGTINSGMGGTLSATYNIPDQLKGSNRVAIRLQTSHAAPYFAYNWFWNNTAPGTGTGGAPGFTGIPTLEVVNVVPGDKVGIRTNNFPPNQNFTVTMGPMGTQGVGGTVVGQFNSGFGGVLTAEFAIPDALKSAYQVAIRAQTSHSAPFFAYNWFYNNTTGTGGQPPPPTTPPAPGYTGTPTFTICAVAQNSTVTIKTKDYPPNQTFQVTMGAFGTQGIGGHSVGVLNSGVGGELTATFNIPAQLAGANRIAIRTQTAHAAPFFAYNWFFNTTTTATSC